MPEYSKSRRNFLRHSGQFALASVAAMNFGCAIAPQIDREDRVAIIYGTRYGATWKTAFWISQGMNRPVDILDIEKISLKKTAQKYNKFIIGSGIWADGAHKKLIEFLTLYKPQVQNRLLAAFIVCGTTGEDEAGKQRIDQYLGNLLGPLDKKPALQAHFGGRMIIEKLNEQDRKMLENFYKKVLKREFASWDRTQPKEAAEFGTRMAEILWG